MVERKKSEKVSRARYDAVMWQRVCPGCHEYKVVDIVRRSKKDALDRGSKYLGSFHQCGGPSGHDCWHMSKLTGNKPIYETFGDTPSQKEDR